MTESAEVVFLLDVDNTLLDNDRFATDLTNELEQQFGRAERLQYWKIYADLREQTGYADYLGALKQLRAGHDDETGLLKMSAFLLHYPFHERLYPRALEAIAHLHQYGTAVILSDGDIVLQTRKIQSAGLWDAVEGRVLVYLHKERMLDVIERRFPSRHYVMIDDKPRLLAAVKHVLGERLTSVFVRQGHYAAESVGVHIDPEPDVTVDHIGALCDIVLPGFLAVGGSRSEALHGDGLSALLTRDWP